MIHHTIFPATQLVPWAIIVPIMICKDTMHASIKQAYTQAITTAKRQATHRRVRLISKKCFCSINPRLILTFDWLNIYVGAESDQLVNIYSFAVRCDQRWPSTQWHRIYTDLGNVPYVQSGSVGDFIHVPRCSKSAVGLQTRGRKMGCTRGPIGSGWKGRERQELRYELSVQVVAWGPNLAVLWLWAIELRNSN